MIHPGARFPVRACTKAAVKWLQLRCKRWYRLPRKICPSSIMSFSTSAGRSCALPIDTDSRKRTSPTHCRGGITKMPVSGPCVAQEVGKGMNAVCAGAERRRCLRGARAAGSRRAPRRRTRSRRPRRRCGKCPNRTNTSSRCSSCRRLRGTRGRGPSRLSLISLSLLSCHETARTPAVLRRVRPAAARQPQLTAISAFQEAGAARRAPLTHSASRTIDADRGVADARRRRSQTTLHRCLHHARPLRPRPMDQRRVWRVLLGRSSSVTAASHRARQRRNGRPGSR